MSDKGLSTHAYRQKMASWLIRNFKKFDVKTQQDEQEYENAKNNEKLLSNFKLYLENMNKNLD